MYTAIIERNEPTIIRMVILKEDEDTGAREVVDLIDFPASKEPTYNLLHFVTLHEVQSIEFRKAGKAFALIEDPQSANSMRRASLFFAHIAASALGYSVDPEDGCVGKYSVPGVDPVDALIENPRGDLETMHRVIY